MAKYEPMELLLSLKGKVCGHSNIYFASRNGTKYTGKICNPYTGAPSVLQTAQRNKFKQALLAVGALTQEQEDAYEVAFKKQNKYKTLRGYMFAMEYGKLGN